MVAAVVVVVADDEADWRCLCNRYAIDFINSSSIIYFHLKKFYVFQGNSKYQTQISWHKLSNNELSMRFHKKHCV